MSDYPRKGRPTKGVRTIKVTDRKGELVTARPVGEGHQLLLISLGGQVIRIDAESVRKTGRSTEGVRLMDLPDDDQVATVAAVLDNDEPTDADEITDESAGRCPARCRRSETPDEYRVVQPPASGSVAARRSRIATARISGSAKKDKHAGTELHAREHAAAWHEFEMPVVRAIERIRPVEPDVERVGADHGREGAQHRAEERRESAPGASARRGCGSTARSAPTGERRRGRTPRHQRLGRRDPRRGGSRDLPANGTFGGVGERGAATGKRRRNEREPDDLCMGMLQGRAGAGALVDEQERGQAPPVCTGRGLANGPAVIAAVSSSVWRSHSATTWRGVLTMTSWTPSSGGSTGNRFGTARTRQPGPSGGDPSGRSAHTSRGV